MKILIFKTSVKDKTDLQLLTPILNKIVTDGHWTIDLNDHDKILRIESNKIVKETICKPLNGLGFKCVELED